MGMSIRDIAEETGIHRSKVHRLKQRIDEETGAGPAAAGGTGE
jgi:transposase